MDPVRVQDQDQVQGRALADKVVTAAPGTPSKKIMQHNRCLLMKALTRARQGHRRALVAVQKDPLNPRALVERAQVVAPVGSRMQKERRVRLGNQASLVIQEMQRLRLKLPWQMRTNRFR